MRLLFEGGFYWNWYRFHCGYYSVFKGGCYLRAATISDITVYEQVSIFHTTFFVYGNQIKNVLLNASIETISAHISYQSMKDVLFAWFTRFQLTFFKKLHKMYYYYFEYCYIIWVNTKYSTCFSVIFDSLIICTFYLVLGPKY